MVKMSLSTYIVIPIAIALQAVTIMILTPYVALTGTVADAAGLITWISFQAWAVYFMAGCTPKMGVKALLGYAGGIIQLCTTCGGNIIGTSGGGDGGLTATLGAPILLVTHVPEPTTAALIGLGVLGLAIAGRRK